MNTDRLYKQLSPLAYAAFRESAKQRALQARRDAIDAFWSALGDRLATARRALQPATNRVPCKA